MLTAIKRGIKKEYIPECEKNSDNPTKFIFKGLIHSEMLEVNSILEVQVSKTDNNKATIKNSMQTVMPILKKGIVEIQNFETNPGEVKNITEITDEILESLPFEIIMELFHVISEETKMSGVEEKN